MRQIDRAQGRIEGREQHIGFEHVRARQTVKQRGFSGIRVADKAQRSDMARARDLRDAIATLFDFLEFGFDLPDALGDHAAIGLNLRLARAAKKAEAAALTLKMRP